MPLRLHQDISNSKNIIGCKGCHVLMLKKYFDNDLCKDCDAKYNNLMNKFMLY